MTFGAMAALFLEADLQTVPFLTLVYIFVLWLCWRIAKQLLEKHPLANIQGPPSPSFIVGTISTHSHTQFSIDECLTR